MQNVKKFFVLFLAIGFLYEGNAAIAGKSKGPELDKQTLARRTVKQKTTKLQLIPRTIAHTKKRFAILPKSSVVQLKKSLIHRNLLKTRTPAVRGNKAVLQPTNLLAKRALSKTRTTAVKGNKAVLQPTNLLAKRALSKTRTTAVKVNKAVVQPTKTLLTQQGRTLTRKAKPTVGALGKRVNRTIKPTPQDVSAVRRRSPASLGNNTPSQTNNRITIRTADLPPAVVQGYTAKGKRLPAQFQISREEAADAVSSLEQLERAGQSPAGLAQQLRTMFKNKYNVAL